MVWALWGYHHLDVYINPSCPGKRNVPFLVAIISTITSFTVRCYYNLTSLYLSLISLSINLNYILLGILDYTLLGASIIIYIDLTLG